MFCTLRIWSLAFGIYDGRCSEVKRKTWNRTALKEVPSLFDYLSFLFCFMGLISGPVYPFKIYKECCEMECTGEQEKEDVNNGFQTYCAALLFVIMFLIANMLLPNRYIESEQFASYNYFVRMVLLLIIGFGRNGRYFFAWLSSEAAFRTFGLARVSDFDFEEIRSIRIGRFMVARDLGETINEWHYSVATTLKEYLYLRLIIHLHCPPLLSRVIVFATSAYWHGFFSGYVALAVMAGVFSVVDRKRRDAFSPIVERFVGEKWTFWFNVFFTHVIVWFVTAPWDLLWAWKYFRFYKGMYFGPFVACIALWGIGLVFGPKRKSESRPPKEPVQKQNKSD
jgi:hypothetical protein